MRRAPRRDEDGRAGWKLTLLMPCYLPVMQLRRRPRRFAQRCIVPTRRARPISAHARNGTTRRSSQRILELRRESRTLLGYPISPTLSLVPKMARDPGEVLAFLRDLARRAKPFAERDYAELSAFARDELGIAELEAWDLAYASEKLRRSATRSPTQEVKQYFPGGARCSPALFRVVETLYGVSHPRPRGADVASERALLRHRATRDGALVGQFYLDLYARPAKRGGAWMDDAIDRRAHRRARADPVAYLTCNFSAPLGGASPRCSRTTK